MAIYLLILKALKITSLRRNRQQGNEKLDILLTGTFYSENWISPHLKPLAMSNSCRRLIMVATSPVPVIDKVEAVYPPRLLVSLLGQIPARLLTFIWVGLTTRPHIVGGFHLLLNGLASILLARLIGARSLYFCGGGPREVIGGGYLTENRLFSLLKEPDLAIENQLIEAVKEFDFIITMGSGTVKFFKEQGVDSNFNIMPGGFDGSRFCPSEEPPTADIVFIGRLSEVKRVDIFLRAVKCLVNRNLDVTAVIVGDGPSRQTLEDLSHELNLSSHVSFVGYREDVETWLKSSRIFVLTSDSEGVSQAMIQAMLCGLPVVVSKVGDLGDLVEDGVNGYLITERTPELFAERLCHIMTNHEVLSAMRKAARSSAEKLVLEGVAEEWDKILH